MNKEKKLVAETGFLDRHIPLWEKLLVKVLPKNLRSEWLDLRNYEIVLTPNTLQLKQGQRYVAIEGWDLKEACKHHFENDQPEEVFSQLKG